MAMVRLFVPPVALTAVVPAPMTNFSRRSGVELLPLHRTHPVGIAASAPDQMTMPPAGKVVFRTAWVLVTGPVILGKVALMVLLIRRMWSSAAERASVAAGLVATRSSMYVPVSKAILKFPLCVGVSVFFWVCRCFLGGPLLKEVNNNNNKVDPLPDF